MLGTWSVGEVSVGMWDLCGAFDSPYSSALAVVWMSPFFPDFVYSISFHFIYSLQ